MLLTCSHLIHYDEQLPGLHWIPYRVIRRFSFLMKIRPSHVIAMNIELFWAILDFPEEFIIGKLILTDIRIMLILHLVSRALMFPKIKCSVNIISDN